MADLSTPDALRLFNICQVAAKRVAMADEDDRHDFALRAFEGFFEKDRADTSDDYMMGYAVKSIQGMVKNKLAKERKMLRESACTSEDGESYFELFLPVVSSRQEDHVDAATCSRILAGLPDWHRESLEVLADGGTPLDICRERKIPLKDAMDMVKRARSLFLDEFARLRLEKARWPLGPRCPECAGHHSYWLTTRRRYKCRDCHTQYSVTTNSALASHKLSFSKIIEIANLVFEGATASEIHRETEVQYITAYHLRDSMLSVPWLRRLGGIDDLPQAA